MRSAVAYLQEQAEIFAGRAAIVGKGPSSAEFDAQGVMRERFVIGLNEVSLNVPCHAAFIIDEDIFQKHAEQLSGRGMSVFITPRVLHSAKKVGGLTIYVPSHNASAEAGWRRILADRLLQFNLGTSRSDPGLGGTVKPYNFSAPTLAHLLAMCGFKDICLAGVDGGTQYASAFREYEHKKLKSIQDSYDVQFHDLRRVRDKFGVRFSTTRCEEATILIGSQREQCLAEEVLKWSIDSRSCLTPRYVDISDDSKELYAQGQTGTPFSLQRLYLPRLSNHRGRGVYFDSDMLVMRDVFELFNWDMGENIVLGCLPTTGRAPQFSVFLVDNAHARWDPDSLLADYREGRASYNDLIHKFSFIEECRFSLPMYWNSLEHFDLACTANIHFTDMSTQPWLSVFNPYADIWCDALFKAAEARSSVREALELSNRQGWVRPSLQWQLEHMHVNPWTLPQSIKNLDRDWLPPHIAMRRASAPHKLRVLRWHLSSRVRRLRQSQAARILAQVGTAFRKLV